MPKSYVQGRFSPKNPKKYKGDVTQIIFRSSWELKVFSRLDADDRIEWWCSEAVAIPYRSPLDDKVHRYFPDLVFRYKDEQGTRITMMVEIKPEAQTIPPVPGKKKTRKLLKEAATYAVNETKWDAAKAYCEDRGWHFKIWTERDIGIPNWR